MIPVIDFAAMMARDAATMETLRRGAGEVGFLTLTNTPLGPDRVGKVIESYRAFFRLPERDKDSVNMAKTGANRGWGASQSEQVDPAANPDYKQVFDCGFELAPEDPMRGQSLSVYADNLWPEGQDAFRQEVEAYFSDALGVAQQVLAGIATATGHDASYFADKFSRPMALLRGNYYPPRPRWAGDKDFGIGAHTDYGCITLLATDGVPGLEVEMPDGMCRPLVAQPRTFVINFGEMLEMWTDGAVRATLHRVRGGPDERLSVPLFFNPNHDADVAPAGASEPILAGAHLGKRFRETYVHMQTKSG